MQVSRDAKTKTIQIQEILNPTEPTHLWRVVEVEGLVEAEVDKAKESGVELGEGGHHSVVHVCRVLKDDRRAEEVSTANCTQSGHRV